MCLFVCFFVVNRLNLEISECINKQDVNELLALLKGHISPYKTIVNEANVNWYMAQLTKEKETRLVTQAFPFFLSLNLLFLLEQIKKRTILAK